LLDVIRDHLDDVPLDHQVPRQVRVDTPGGFDGYMSQ
jgi:hypothetical protein